MSLEILHVHPPISNMNFPAPASVLGFLAACAGTFAAAAAALVAWFIRKPRIARAMALLVAAGAVVYFSFLFGLSLVSHDSVLNRGQEKYFCEIDCHLAYSVVEVKTESAALTTRYFVTLRTRFDETTISSRRPKDATLTPNPRILRLIDPSAREYSPAAVHGTPLDTPLKPTDSYTTQLEFDLPKGTAAFRLLVTTKGSEQHLMMATRTACCTRKPTSRFKKAISTQHAARKQGAEGWVLKATQQYQAPSEPAVLLWSGAGVPLRERLTH